MKLPDGSLVAETDKPIAEVLGEYEHDFRGCILVERGKNGMSSEGFIIVEDGNVLAAAFSTLGIMLYQMKALDWMMSLNDVVLKVYSYTEKEKHQVFDVYPDSVIGGLPPNEGPVPEAGPEEEPEAGPAEMEATPEEEPEAAPEPEPITYDALLSTVVRLPGVIAAAMVADGLPIYQQGQQVDFEHIAVATEDMVRSGTKIATELQLGDAEEILLETPSNKVVIAPINDIFLCVLTTADANLGLVRLSIKNAQANMRD